MVVADVLQEQRTAKRARIGEVAENSWRASRPGNEFRWLPVGFPVGSQPYILPGKSRKQLDLRYSIFLRHLSLGFLISRDLLELEEKTC